MAFNSESTQMEEDMLGNKIKKGCEKSFNKIYDKYKNRLLGMAINRLHDRTLAEDVVSIIFMKVWERCHQWDDTKGHFISWVYTIANHQIISVYRSDKSAIEVSLSIDNEGLKDSEIAELVSQDTPEIYIDDVIFTEVVEVLLSNIPNESIKQCWRMFHVQGYSINQIADELQITETTVKLRSWRCASQMRNMIRRNPDYYM